jgi:hypothetical protein
VNVNADEIARIARESVEADRQNVKQVQLEVLRERYLLRFFKAHPELADCEANENILIDYISKHRRDGVAFDGEGLELANLAIGNLLAKKRPIYTPPPSPPVIPEPVKAPAPESNEPHHSQAQLRSGGKFATMEQLKPSELHAFIKENAPESVSLQDTNTLPPGLTKEMILGMSAVDLRKLTHFPGARGQARRKNQEVIGDIMAGRKPQ